MMNSSYSKISFYVIVGLLVSMTATSLQAQQLPLAEAPITVIGSDDVQVKPDLAVVSLGVVSTSKQAKVAVSENNKAMAELIKALQALDVAEKDMQTDGFSVVPDIVNVDRAGRAIAPRITGYTVNNSLTVRLRNPVKLGELLDIAVDHGINQIGQVRFTTSNPKEAIDKARAAAVKDAVNKARIMADAAGVKLGRIIYMNDNSANANDSLKDYASGSPAADESQSAVPTAAGELTYTVNVSLSFAISQ